MASAHFAFLAVCVAAFSTVAHSQANDLTISQPRGAYLTNVNVTIDFPAEAVIGKCNVADRVCGRIVGHQEKFTIRAGTNIPVGEHYFRVTGKTGKFKIVIEKDFQLVIPPEQRLYGLEVQHTAVTRDTTYTVPFLIANMEYGIPYRSDAQQTAIQLNGPMQSQPVYLQFAANKDGSGKKFTLRICPDFLNCAVDNQADVRDDIADYKRPPLETQPVNTGGSAENRKPPPEIQPANRVANADYRRPPLETQSVNDGGYAENRKPPPEIKHVDTAANAGYNRRLSKEQPTSTAANAFSLVLIFLWSARLLVEM